MFLTHFRPSLPIFEALIAFFNYFHHFLLTITYTCSSPIILYQVCYFFFLFIFILLTFLGTANYDTTMNGHHQPWDEDEHLFWPTALWLVFTPTATTTTDDNNERSYTLLWVILFTMTEADDTNIQQTTNERGSNDSFPSFEPLGIFFFYLNCIRRFFDF